MKSSILQMLAIILLGSCHAQQAKTTKDTVMNESKKDNPVYSNTDTGKIDLSNAEWRKILPQDLYQIAREKGTERAFTGKYWNSFDTGTYYCGACGNPLFKSDGKFNSSCGWPSFFEPITKGSIIYAADNSYGMQRTEVMCGRCKSHLGHVFEDGPPPTGLRYCINGNVLDFQKAKDKGQH
ncbi:MAG: peptide-methionine (R)-S-oxide reductase MsrB [Ferruginibacter sp.]